jgi:hypothetical protein
VQVQVQVLVFWALARRSRVFTRAPAAIPADRVEQPLCGNRRSVGSDHAGHGDRSCAGLGGQGRRERGGLSTSNWPAINSAARSGRDDGGGAPVVNARADRPTGTNGAPTLANRRSNSSSGGAHTRTSTPSARNRTASPTSGSTSPRDP